MKTWQFAIILTLAVSGPIAFLFSLNLDTKAIERISYDKGFQDGLSLVNAVIDNTGIEGARIKVEDYYHPPYGDEK